MKRIKENTIYQFRRIKTYKPEEVIAAGGTDAFAKLTNYNYNILLNLHGEPLTEEQYKNSVASLTK